MNRHPRLPAEKINMVAGGEFHLLSGQNVTPQNHSISSDCWRKAAVVAGLPTPVAAATAESPAGGLRRVRTESLIALAAARLTGERQALRGCRRVPSLLQ